MAAADYALCLMCNRKVYYDADVDYQPGTQSAALCTDHSATHTLIAVPDEYVGKALTLPGAH
jgi:hypothetical protein